MKQRYLSAAHRILRRCAVGFAQITARASQRQIGKFVEATLGSRDDVLHVKRRPLEALMHEAVLTPVGSPPANCSLKEPRREDQDGKMQATGGGPE